MAWAWVQGNAADSGSGTVATFPCAYSSDPLAGDLLVAAVTYFSVNATGLATAMADSIGNVWQLATSVQDSADTHAIFYATNKSTAANTVTFTVPGSANFVRLFVHEYSGSNLILDQVGTGTGTSGGATTNTVTTLYANELLVALIRYDSGTVTLDATYTPRETLASGSNQTFDKNGATVGNYTATASTGVAVKWSILLATFFENVPGQFTPHRMPLGV